MELHKTPNFCATSPHPMVHIIKNEDPVFNFVLLLFYLLRFISYFTGEHLF